jgi:hypothetical protein
MAGAGDLRPLDAAIEEIRLLHEAAERTAARIGAAAGQLAGGEATTDALAADVADALVGRTEMIREDCERLSDLLRRTRAALTATPGPPARSGRPIRDIAPAPAEPKPPASPAPYPFDPPLARVEAAAGLDIAEQPPAWQFWRRRRGERPQVGQAPPRLPRPDYAAMGVGPAAYRADPAVGPGRPPVPEGVRLIATQMAVAGSSRTEIARRLQRQFGIADAEPALNEIFGYDAGARVE